uniref:guanylate kinase n=1 Tax=Dermatophagoides pteronyssinus TaxID=6956 RepID=A0A6P6XXI0_DERPT
RMPNRVLVVFGPSGVGKGSTIRRARERFGAAVALSISHTTRAPREGEAHGVDYYFVSKPEFERMLAAGELVEHTRYNDNYYGTSVAELQRLAQAPGAVPIVEVEVEGVQKLQQLPDLGAFYLVMKPPRVEVLRARLRLRGTETEAEIERRCARAREELALYERCHVDYTLVNDDLDAACREIKV